MEYSSYSKQMKIVHIGGVLKKKLNKWVYFLWF